MSYESGKGLAGGGARYAARPLAAPPLPPGTYITRAAPGVSAARAGMIPTPLARLWNALPADAVEGHEPDPFYDVRSNYVDGGLGAIELDVKRGRYTAALPEPMPPYLSAPQEAGATVTSGQQPSAIEPAPYPSGTNGAGFSTMILPIAVALGALWFFTR